MKDKFVNISTRVRILAKMVIEFLVRVSKMEESARWKHERVSEMEINPSLEISCIS